MYIPVKLETLELWKKLSTFRRIKIKLDLFNFYLTQSIKVKDLFHANINN